MQALGCGFSLAPEPGSNTEVPLMPGGDHRQPLHLSSFALFARGLGIIISYDNLQQRLL